MTKPDDNEPVTRLWFLTAKCLPGRFAVEVQPGVSVFIVSSGRVYISVPGIQINTTVKTRGECRLLLELLEIKRENG